MKNSNQYLRFIQKNKANFEKLRINNNRIMYLGTFHLNEPETINCHNAYSILLDGEKTQEQINTLLARQEKLINKYAKFNI
jgi:hypothetical protein